MRAPIREIPATAAALVVACGVEIAVRLLPLPRASHLFGAPLRESAAPGAPQVHGAQLGPRGRSQARAVRRVMRRWPFGDTCLRHALVAGHRLRRFGPELVVGVSKVDGAVKAHAWLEFDTGIYDPLQSAQAFLPLGTMREEDE